MMRMTFQKRPTGLFEFHKESKDIQRFIKRLEVFTSPCKECATCKQVNCTVQARAQ